MYRARDTRLGREVALKVLPAAFASDPERMARFQREAQVLASLNHPRIGAIYGFEDSNGIRALVMELIEGPTLADRIARGAIPVDEALPLAREIAEALEAAHDRGIVHRDLKPANIKITSDGDVKVLDFGLAKAVEGDVSSTDIQILQPSAAWPRKPELFWAPLHTCRRNKRKARPLIAARTSGLSVACFTKCSQPSMPSKVKPSPTPWQP